MDLITAQTFHTQSYLKLSNGVLMPPLVQTTNWQNEEQMTALVTEGLRVGFRAFDTARDYGNEHIVGKVLERCLKEAGLTRQDIFITTKIGNSQQAKGDIQGEIEKSLDNLRTDYVDCWLMHWPYPGYYVRTYREMEKVYATGKAHAIGMANYHVRHFRHLFESGIEVMPHVAQFEHHPMRTADEIRSLCAENQIAIQGYSPICRMIPKIRESATLIELAERYHKSIPQIILRWHVQHHSVPVFKTMKPFRLKENFDIWDFNLTDAEMATINALDEDYKYHLESASCPGF